jgi:hypothetical protein
MKITSLLVTAAAIGLVATAAPALAAGKSGATLSASKTVDICVQTDSQWRYSGDVSVWNDGANATLGLAINDCVENKNLSGPGWTNIVCTPNLNTGAAEIAGLTDEVHATVFHFTAVGAPGTNTIRNNAKVTILNHSGQPANVPYGPNPKATYTGSVPPPACPVDVVEVQCTYSQGYWKNHHDKWPAGYDLGAQFFLSGMTWSDQAGETGGNGYNILAVQYIAAELNIANGSPVPSGLQDVLDQATAWFAVNGPASVACPKGSSCAPQKTWGGILEDYNLGGYPGSPGHCGDAAPAPVNRN